MALTRFLAIALSMSLAAPALALPGRTGRDGGLIDATGTNPRPRLDDITPAGGPVGLPDIMTPGERVWVGVKALAAIGIGIVGVVGGVSTISGTTATGLAAAAGWFVGVSLIAGSTASIAKGSFDMYRAISGSRSYPDWVDRAMDFVDALSTLGEVGEAVDDARELVLPIEAQPPQATTNAPEVAGPVMPPNLSPPSITPPGVNCPRGDRTCALRVTEAPPARVFGVGTRH